MRRFLPLLLLLIAPALHAQVIAIYGTFSPAHLSNVESGAVYSATAPGGYTEATASYWSPGFGLGATFNFIPAGPIRLGLDVRASAKPGTQTADSALVGLKLGIRPPLLKFKPYLQGSFGYLNTQTPNVSNLTTTTTTSTTTTVSLPGSLSTKYAAYEILGGVDYPLLGPLDVRIVEIGVGGGLGSTYNPTFVTVNSGLVLHF
jgi:hypothetical protein